MGSVPNCREEIPVCDAIRWFKCKLKPPKNSMILLFLNWWIQVNTAAVTA